MTKKTDPQETPKQKPNANLESSDHPQTVPQRLSVTALLQKTDFEIKSGMAIIDRIKQVLQAKAWKQKHLADETGITRSTLSSFLNDYDKIMSNDIVLTKIANALGVSKKSLITGKGHLPGTGLNKTATTPGPYKVSTKKTITVTAEITAEELIKIHTAIRRMQKDNSASQLAAYYVIGQIMLKTFKKPQFDAQELALQLDSLLPADTTHTIADTLGKQFAHLDPVVLKQVSLLLFPSEEQESTKSQQTPQDQVTKHKAEAEAD